ncbi:glutamine amidotransferase [Intrasporangium oryzae NRRL B-24470]|uniref:Glutamine amidotransferase n=1 Tax=Intrasporangium oryzae NRRL B-24470 TaxID=1386089 RepID=W9GCN3_9MICO|nr:class II glutamine amidotransferase [Intrasporangium oryzae]EWT01609.1 glutamine amidotransferase [Intrasporangium oryzae NRRL B-24470]
MVYSGDPVLAEDLLFKPEHSLIEQSLHSKMGATTTNGDGFGIGWYGEGSTPAIFKSVDPAWNDRNLRELTSQVRTPLLFAHVRASTGTEVQRSNCHPFRHDGWLWMHNGVLNGFHDLRRELVFAVDPSLYPEIEGSTDSEVLFFLALTFGLEEDPVEGVAKAVGFVEERAERRGIPNAVQATMATTNGESVWCFRYSTQHQSRSLFHSTALTRLRELHPEVEMLQRLGVDTRFVVSEPLRDLPGAWREVPESSVGIIQPGADEIRTFEPQRPAVML